MVSPVGAETGTGGMCPMSTPGATASTPLPHSGRMDKDLSRDELAAREKKERDRTYHRLLETTQAVIDYMVRCEATSLLLPAARPELPLNVLYDRLRAC
jgi:hypothetical protein